MAKLPEILKKSVVAKSRFFTVEELHLRFSNGVQRVYERLRTPPVTAVMVVALQDDGDTVLMIREYGAGLETYTLGLPKGALEADETLEQGANRELQEEVGVTAGKVQRLTTVWTTPGFTDEAIHLFMATDLTPTAHNREPDEFIDVVPKALSEVLEMVGRGEVCDAKTVVGILYMAGYILGQ